MPSTGSPSARGWSISSCRRASCSVRPMKPQTSAATAPAPSASSTISGVEGSSGQVWQGSAHREGSPDRDAGAGNPDRCRVRRQPLAQPRVLREGLRRARIPDATRRRADTRSGSSASPPGHATAGCLAPWVDTRRQPLPVEAGHGKVPCWAPGQPCWRGRMACRARPELCALRVTCLTVHGAVAWS
jgi:hypothetical protein